MDLLRQAFNNYKQLLMQTVQNYFCHTVKFLAIFLYILGQKIILIRA